MEFSKRGFCVFLSNVVCSFQKYDKPVVLGRCLTCSYYLRFVREKEVKEEEFWDKIDAIRGAEYCCVCRCNLGSGNRSDVWNVCGRCKHILEM